MIRFIPAHSFPSWASIRLERLIKFHDTECAFDSSMEIFFDWDLLISLDPQVINHLAVSKGISTWPVAEWREETDRVHRHKQYRATDEHTAHFWSVLRISTKKECSIGDIDDVEQTTVIS